MYKRQLRKSKKSEQKEKVLESTAIEGDSPVSEFAQTLDEDQSTAGHGKPCGKMGGPPSKAKYYLVTDSELVP